MNIATIGMPGAMPAAQTPLQQLAAAAGAAPSFGSVLQATTSPVAALPAVSAASPMPAASTTPAESVQPIAQAFRAQPLLLAGSAIVTTGSVATAPIATPATIELPVPESAPALIEAAASPAAAPVEIASAPGAAVQPKIAAAVQTALQPHPNAPSPTAAPASDPLPASVPASAVPIDAQKPSDQLAAQEPTDDILPLEIPVTSEAIAPDASVIAAPPAPAPAAPSVMAPVPVKSLAAGLKQSGTVSDTVTNPDAAAHPVAPAALAAAASPTSAPVEARTAASAASAIDLPSFEPIRSDAPALMPALPRTEAAPAQIGDRFQPAPLVSEEPVITAQTGRLGRDMGVEIARHVVAGKDEVVIRLNPVELGRIEVRMSFDEAGSLRAVLTAESSVALDMLRRDAGDLGRTLAEAGVRADLDSLKFANRGGGDGAQPGWSNREHSGARDDRGQRDGRERSAAGEPAHDSDYRSLPASGRVDLMA